MAPAGRPSVPSTRAAYLGDVVTLLDDQVIVLESDLAVASGAGVGAGEGLEALVEGRREGLDARGKTVAENENVEDGKRARYEVGAEEMWSNDSG
jgi:hypothetical protein